MPRLKIYRLKDHVYQHFRWAAHTAGASQVKRKDYEEGGEVEADGAYAAWTMLRDSERALRAGDLLESQDGTLRIYKYVGFEEAHWVIPEMKRDETVSASDPGQEPATETPKPD